MGDVYADYVDALATFNGSDAATSFTPEAGPAAGMAFQGTAQLDTAVVQFGSAALYMPVQNNDWVQWGNTGDWTYLHDGTTDWTIDGWYYCASDTGDYRTLFDSQGSGGYGVYFYIHWSNPHYRFVINLNGTDITVITGNNTAIFGEWVYFCITFEVATKTATVYINGDELGSDTQTSTFYSNASAALVLGRDVSIGLRSLIGWLDDFRITKILRDGSVPTAEASLTPGYPSYILLPNPIGQAALVARSNYAGQLAAIDAAPDHPKRYAMSDVTTAATAGYPGGGLYPRWICEVDSDPVLRVPVSSFSATVQTGRSQYLQAAVPNAGDYMADLTAAVAAADYFGIYRLDLLDGIEIKTQIARAPLQYADPSQGPTNYSVNLSGYAAAADEPETPETITLPVAMTLAATGGRQRLRCPIVFNLYPGDTVEYGAASFTADYLSYYVNETQAYIDLGER